MIRTAAGALALAASTSLPAQSASSDLTYSAPLAGNWRYTPTATGTEASFLAPSGVVQLTLRCTRQARAIAISKPASAPSASLWIWTSLQARSVPATYNPQGARIDAQLSAFDGLLDAMASSRGRIGFNGGNAATAVLPASGEVARVVEDCRA